MRSKPYFVIDWLPHRKHKKKTQTQNIRIARLMPNKTGRRGTQPPVQNKTRVIITTTDILKASARSDRTKEASYDSGPE